MKTTDNMRKMKGTLLLTVLNRQGEVVATYTQHNLIVDSGYQAVAGALAGVEGAKIAYFAVGTNGNDPAPADTAIENGVCVPLTFEVLDNAAVRFDFIVDYDIANGKDIQEFGLLTQDGRLFSRLTREEHISKTEEMMLAGSWTINI